MAVSGVSTWTQNRDQIITQALSKLRVVSPGDTPTAEQVTHAADVLNGIVKNLQVEGVRLWTVEEVTQTFTASSIVNGSDGSDYVCIKSHTSTPAFAPVTGADWSTYWKKLATAAGVAWANSTAYTSVADFTVAADTIAIEKAFVRHNETDYPVEIIDQFTYADISQKWWESRPTSLWLDLQLTPVAYLYPVPEDTTYVLHYLRIRKLYDYVNATDTSDFPVRWIDPLIMLLSAALSDTYSIELNERLFFEKKAERLKLRAKADDKEIEDFNFVTSAFREAR